MSRAGLVNPMEQTIEEYGVAIEQKNQYTKLIKDLGDNIKKHFLDNNLSKLSSGSYTAKVTVTEKEDFDESIGIELLKKLVEEGTLTKRDLNKIVKKKEYIDEDALEKALYNGLVTAQDIEKARIRKDPTYTLRITKKK